MTATPRCFLPVAIFALLWNLLGCLAYWGDVMLARGCVVPGTERIISP